MVPRPWYGTIRRTLDDWRLRSAIERRLETYVGRRPTPWSRLRRLVAL